MPQPLHAHAWDEETCTGRRIDAPAHLQSVLDPDRRGRRRAAKSTRSPGPGGGEAWHKSKNGRVVISRPFPNASYRTAQSNHIGDLVVVRSLTYRHPGELPWARVTRSYPRPNLQTQDRRQVSDPGCWTVFIYNGSPSAGSSPRRAGCLSETL